MCLQLEDCALQLCKHNGSQHDYGMYLDLESTIDEQMEDLEGFTEKSVFISVVTVMEVGTEIAFFGETERNRNCGFYAPAWMDLKHGSCYLLHLP